MIMYDYMFSDCMAVVPTYHGDSGSTGDRLGEQEGKVSVVVPPATAGARTRARLARVDFFFPQCYNQYLDCSGRAGSLLSFSCSNTCIRTQRRVCDPIFENTNSVTTTASGNVVAPSIAGGSAPGALATA